MSIPGVAPLPATGSSVRVDGATPATLDTEQPPLWRLFSVAVGMVLLMSAAVLYATDPMFRRVEARASVMAINWLGFAHARWIHGTSIFQVWGGPNDRAWGFNLEAECSVGFIVATFALLTAPFLLTGRTRILRAVFACVGVGIFMLLVNIARMCLIAWMSVDYGNQGFTLAHTILGSVLVLVCLALSSIQMFRVIVLHPSRAWTGA